jgi:uncharacterized membrane protein (GlpM family)
MSIWLIIIPFISSFCYQFDGIFIGASQTKELKNAMIFSVICLFNYFLILTKLFFKYRNLDFSLYLYDLKSSCRYFII